nr:uncharacterized protein LOC104648697 [Solanum lycopersicum]
MSISIYKKLGLGEPKPTAMRPLIANRFIKRRTVILHDILEKVESFIFPADFLILDCEVNFEVSIINQRPFLATGRSLVYTEKGQLKFRLNNEKGTLNICRSMRQSGTSTPSRAPCATRATPTKVASSVITTSQSDEERTLTDIPSGSATNEKRASGSLGVSWSEEASGSAEVTAPANTAASAFSDDADSSDSTLGSPAHSLTPATNQPNQ